MHTVPLHEGDGVERVPNEEMRQMLYYLGEITFENAVNEELRNIETVKKNPEVGGMRIQILDEVIKLSEEKARLLEEKARVTEEYARAMEERARLLEEKVKLMEEKAKQWEERAKLAEELNQKNIRENMTGNG